MRFVSILVLVQRQVNQKISRRTKGNKLWPDAVDVVPLLRLAGGLNEIVCMRFDQLMWGKGKLRL